MKIIILALLVLDWVALHDIFKNEPDTFGEYAMLLVSVIIFTTLGLARYFFGKK